MAKGRAGATASHARLSPYVKGIILGMSLAGMASRDIAKQVVKGDGTHPPYQTVSATLKRCLAEGGLAWNGEARAVGRGPPRKTSAALDRRIVRTVFKHRGSAKVTVDFLRKQIPALRKVSKSTISRRLSEAGLAWLRRRRKSLVPAPEKQARIDFSRWVLSRTVATLRRWVYSDGASFYLARDAAQKESTSRGALGTHVWRMASGADALFEDVVGPSAYWKAQGTCIRIWGLLVAGVLYVTVLPEGTVMNRWEYARIVARHFPGWISAVLGEQARAILIQDHERALWTDEARAAIESSGIELLERYPKCSQDLNVIETAWRELRARLYATEPAGLEDRAAFVARLRSAVAWVNRNRQSYLRERCFAQKERAKDVIALNGGRTKH